MKSTIKKAPRIAPRGQQVLLSLNLEVDINRFRAKRRRQIPTRSAWCFDTDGESYKETFRIERRLAIAWKRLVLLGRMNNFVAAIRSYGMKKIGRTLTESSSLLFPIQCITNSR